MSTPKSRDVMVFPRLKLRFLRAVSIASMPRWPSPSRNSSCGSHSLLNRPPPMSDAPPAVRVPAESVLTTAHLSRSAKHNSVGHGPRRDLRPRPDAELVADPLYVAFGGSLRDEQP